MEEVAILGVGMTPWGKFSDTSVPQLNTKVAFEALKNAGVDWKDVGIVVCGSDPWTGIDGMLAGGRMASKLGYTGIPVVNVYTACASGGYALKTAQSYINSGFCDIALVVAASISPTGMFGATSQSSEFDPDDLDVQRFRCVGLTNPTGFAFQAVERMHKYGTTEEDLARVKVKNSVFGALNPRARYKKVYTTEEVLNSPMVAYPLRLLELCATSDGAAAVVLCNKKIARKYTQKPAILAGVGIATPLYGEGTTILDIATNTTSAVKWTITSLTAENAYKEAGMGPDDIDFAEVYDLSSVFELNWYEDIRICNVGDAEKILRDGVTSMGGKIPVNPSGGCSSFGEAIPAQALAQVCELFWQVRGEAGERQVPNAKVGLSINAGKQGNCSSTIVKI